MGRKEGDESQTFRLKLEQLLVECSAPNWDGHGAEPVTPEHVERAARFVSGLPERHLDPDVVPQPDGCISVSWDSEDGRPFSISVELDAQLPYAGVLPGGRQVHGAVTDDAEGRASIIALLDEFVADSRA